MKKREFEKWIIRPDIKLLLDAFKEQHKQYKNELHLLSEGLIKDDTIHKLLLAQGLMRGAQRLIDIIEDGEFIDDE